MNRMDAAEESMKDHASHWSYSSGQPGSGDGAGPASVGLRKLTTAYTLELMVRHFLIFMFSFSWCAAGALEPVRVSPDGAGFVMGEAGKPFRIWGVNYDRDDSAGGGRLLEDYWVKEWETVREDFAEMKRLGANVVRIHLQFGKFMKARGKADEEALGRLGKLVDLARENDLRLLITGLGCYHKKDVPRWYEELAEAERWDAQAVFWRALAKKCRGDAAVFGFDLMNEPVVGGDETDGWLAGELAGSYFVQRLTLHQGERTPQEIAKAWVDKLTAAIRAEDPARLITVGVIPWAMVWPGAKPVFYAPEAAKNLDFVSIHMYPKSKELDKALKALEVYRIGKPLVVGEIFPLACGMEEMDEFIRKSDAKVSGWIGFYWGKTIDEYKAEKPGKISDALIAEWLSYFQAQAPARRSP